MHDSVATECSGIAESSIIVVRSAGRAIVLACRRIGNSCVINGAVRVAEQPRSLGAETFVPVRIARKFANCRERVPSSSAFGQNRVHRIAVLFCRPRRWGKLLT